MSRAPGLCRTSGCCSAFARSPRIHAELRDEDGTRAGRKRVATLMKAASLRGASRRPGFQTTVRDRAARPAPDLVQRDFVALGPHRLWVADITYVPTHAGSLFPAVVMDAWSRRTVGWAMKTHLRTELVLEALDHSDQGCQHTSVEFGKRCRLAKYSLDGLHR